MTKMRALRLLALGALGLGLGLGLTLAARPAAAGEQSQAGPMVPRPGTPVQQAPQEAPIRVQVDMVSTPVAVYDAAGEMVLDLTARDFRIFDNGVEQTIADFDMGGGPLSVAIVVETSSRVESLLPAVRRTGILFTQTVLGPEGDATIIGYDGAVTKLLDFTADHAAIERTFTNLPVGNSGARLYDALSQAVQALQNRPAARRRVIITVAEAVDVGSEETLGRVLREAQLANITIYSVGLSTTAAMVRNPPSSGAPPSATPPGTFGLPPMPGTPQTPNTEQVRAGNLDLLALAAWVVQNVGAAVRERPLEVATTATGGLYQSTLREQSIEAAIDRIGGELHAVYTLSYRPTGTQPTGYHEIQVRVNRPGVQVRSRPGYYLGGG